MAPECGRFEILSLPVGALTGRLHADARPFLGFQAYTVTVDVTYRRISVAIDGEVAMLALPWSIASVHARSRSWSQRRRRRHTAMRTIVHLSDIHFGRLDPATVPPLREAISRLTPNLLGVSGISRTRPTRGIRRC